MKKYIISIIVAIWAIAATIFGFNQYNINKELKTNNQEQAEVVNQCYILLDSAKSSNEELVKQNEEKDTKITELSTEIETLKKKLQ